MYLLLRFVLSQYLPNSEAIIRHAKQSEVTNKDQRYVYKVILVSHSLGVYRMQRSLVYKLLVFCENLIFVYRPISRCRRSDIIVSIF